MSFKEKIKSNPSLKRTAQYLLSPKNDARPRWWIRNFVTPFIHKRGNGSVIRSSARLDVFPYNKFYLGQKSIIESFTTLNNAVGDVVIGNETIIGIGSVLIGPVEVGNHVMFAQHIVASGLNHGYQDVSMPPSKQPVECKQIIIEDNVWIGANAVITAGVLLGKHCVIGAGSVVTKSVPPYCIAVGNPAKVIRTYNFETKQWQPTLPK